MVVMVYKHALNHANVGTGELHIKFSDDYGATWSDEDKYIGGASVTGFPMNPPDCLSGQDAVEPWLMVAPNGNLLLHMWRYGTVAGSNGTYQSISTDGGQSWSTATAINFTGTTDDDYIFATDDYFVYNGVIYAGARDFAGGAEKTIFIKSTDNGATWDYVSDIYANTNEVGLEYSEGNIVALLRASVPTKTYKAVSHDMGLTWTVSEETQVAISGRHRILTKTHLQQGANWWNDNKLIAWGFYRNSSTSRTNAVWFSVDGGLSWSPTDIVDVAGEDGGYGDVIYNATTGKYVLLSYYGTQDVADIKQYDFTVNW